MSSCTVLDPLGTQAIRRPGYLLGCGGDVFWVSLLTTFLNFTCFLLCCTILIISCMQEHFRLMEDVSIEMANFVFDKAAQKVIGCCQTRSPCLYRLVLLTGAKAFIVIFVIFNDKLLSYNNICCTTRRC
jgi:hypothetical protein